MFFKDELVTLIWRSLGTATRATEDSKNESKLNKKGPELHKFWELEKILYSKFA